MTTLAKAKAGANKTFIVQASLMIITYDRRNIFIVRATELLLSLGFFKTVFTLAKCPSRNYSDCDSSCYLPWLLGQ
jgi:hypothetical protein